MPTDNLLKGRSTSSFTPSSPNSNRKDDRSSPLSKNNSQIQEGHLHHSNKKSRNYRSRYHLKVLLLATLLGLLVYNAQQTNNVRGNTSNIDNLKIQKVSEKKTRIKKQKKNSSSGVASQINKDNRGYSNNVLGKDNQSVMKHLNKVVKDYQQAINSKILVQTGSWYHHIGQYREESTAVPVASPATSNEIPSQKRRVLNQQLLRRMHEQQGRWQLSDNKKESKSTSTIIWDNESDIPKYFKRLTEECAKIIVSKETEDRFMKKCFNFMQQLVHKPLCTVRLDSRFLCRNTKSHRRRLLDNDDDDVDVNGEESGGGLTKQQHMIDSRFSRPIESILGEKHFTKKTINIVIIGGGPVGLYLANALMEIQLRVRSPWYYDNEEYPEIKIVVFEKRVVEDGFKKAYSRDWITGMNKPFMADTIDKRILDLLDIFYRSAETALPVNIWETLLLLSNRERGVKFVYGDPASYEYQKLLRDVPNLLMFDATGHRLDNLNRGEHDDDTKSKASSTTAQTTISKWKASTPKLKNLVRRYWSADIELMEEKLNIATRRSTESGTIVYPVFEDDKKAYDINMLKVLNLPLIENMNQKLNNIRLDVNQITPYRWSGPMFSYNAVADYRPDIQTLIQHQYPGFALRSWFISLTPEQSVVLNGLIEKYSEHGEKEIHLDRIPIYEIENNPILQINQVSSALLIMMMYAIDTIGKNGPGPILSSFKYRPFIYADPVVPQGYDILGRKVPLLRIGDSLFTGDPNANSGLESHMQAIRFFQCSLLESTDANCSFDAWKGGEGRRRR